MDISVVIPAFNRENSLSKCLESLFRQDYSKNLFEIIVVDDGSTDDTAQLVNKLAQGYSNIRYFYQSNKGPAAARNLGMLQAKADIVAFTDTDCILSLPWVKNMVEAHKLSEDIAVIGGLTTVSPNNIKAMVSQSLSDGAIQMAIGGKQEIIFFPTCNVSIKKKYLNEKFNEFFQFPAGEDLEFFWRLFKKSNKFVYKQDIKVFHDCHPNFVSFLKQAYLYGRGNYLAQYLHKNHPLLNEVKTENSLNFIFGTIMNFLKIPRFSYLLGRRLIKSNDNFSMYKRFIIYIYFALHKIMYLFGNVKEHIDKTKFFRKTAAGAYHDDKANSLRPEFLILDVTHRCNLKCNICEIRRDKLIYELRTDEIKNIISQAVEWKVKEFVLSGGEAFVRDDIFELLDFVKEKKYHAGILTNGILLNEKFIERLLPYLTSNTLSLCVSLDALTPDIHDDIRGAKGCFEKTVNGLRTISEFKKKHPEINFNVISIILNENLEELLPLAEFLRSINVNSLQFQSLLSNNLIMNQRSTKAKYWVPRERLSVLDNTIDDLINFKKENPWLVRNSENNLSLVKKYFRGFLAAGDVSCRYADKTMLIASNGNVTTCFDCYGDIRQESLQEIYYSRKADEARRKASACKEPCLLPCFCD